MILRVRFDTVVYASHTALAILVNQSKPLTLQTTYCASNLFSQIIQFTVALNSTAIVSS
jgi:hypothetical protein